MIERYSVDHFLRLMDCRKKNTQQPDEYSLADALKLSAASSSLPYVRKIHTIFIKYGFSRFTILMTMLMNSSVKFGNLKDARKIFEEMPNKDVVSWTSMIVGHSRFQLYKESIILFRKMISGGILPNEYSFSGALTACSGLQALKLGQQIHSQVMTSGFSELNLVLTNSLINMYMRCGSITQAQNIFHSMTVKDIITWNEMLLGYVSHSRGEEALKLLSYMFLNGVKPDNYSYAASLAACSDLALLSQGNQIHSCILKNGFQVDLTIANALIDMYAKCGCLISARIVFDQILSKCLVIWTTMITSFGKLGHVEEVFLLFNQMIESNVEPDGVTYLAVLSACNHGGLVDKAREYFKLMIENSVSPKSEHYGCLIDLLSRSGHLIEAFELISQMPNKPSLSIWSCFLSSCRRHGNKELAKFAIQKLSKLEDGHDCVILSNMFASKNDWDESLYIREKMNLKNLKKEPGCSWVEIKSIVHVFLTTDRSHPDMKSIASTLNQLNACIKGEY